MRRLVMIATWIAVIGAGGAVLVSGASAGATVRPVAPKPAVKFPSGLRKRLRTLPLAAGKPLPPNAIQAIKPHALPARPLLAGPSACYVGLPTCSEHPCVEYVSPSASPQVSVPDGAVYAPLPATPRSQCRSATPKPEAVGALVTVTLVRSPRALKIK